MSVKEQIVTYEERWLGIFKLMEEVNEVNHVLSKIMDVESTSPEKVEQIQSLVTELESELGDMNAAMRYFLNHNPQVNRVTVRQRAVQKLRKYVRKKLPGLLVMKPSKA